MKRYPKWRAGVVVYGDASASHDADGGDERTRRLCATISANYGKLSSDIQDSEGESERGGAGAG